MKWRLSRITLPALLAAAFLPCAAAADSRPASIHDLPTRWRDERGQHLKLSRFKGRWTIATLAYTSCPSVCSITIEKLKRIDAGLAKKKVDILVFSMDPDGDTPETMRAFKSKAGIDQAHWHLLAAEDSETRALAERLGMRYGQKSASPASHIMHTIRIVLVSPDGQVKAALDGPDADPSALSSLLPR